MTSNEWFLNVLPSDDELAALGHDPLRSLLDVAKTRAPIEIGFEGEPDPELKKLFQVATKAAAKLKQNSSFVPNAEEQEALHAFIHLVGRPALRTIDGELVGPPENQRRLSSDLAQVNRLLPSVGRLDDANHTPFGTGWFIAKDLLITNNHVVAALCGLKVHTDPNWREKLYKAASASSKAWAKDESLRPRWSSADTPPGGAVGGRVKGVRALHPEFDAALLEVVGVADSKDRILTVSGKGPEKRVGLEIYLLGYPAALAGQTNPAVLKLLFGNGQSVSKRVSPGKLLDKNQSTHDGSSLGGSSGSPVIAFDDHHVRSLHFSGVYGTSNSAVPFWKMREDPFLIDNGIELAK